MMAKLARSSRSGVFVLRPARCSFFVPGGALPANRTTFLAICILSPAREDALAGAVESSLHLRLALICQRNRRPEKGVVDRQLVICSGGSRRRRECAVARLSRWAQPGTDVLHQRHRASGRDGTRRDDDAAGWRVCDGGWSGGERPGMTNPQCYSAASPSSCSPALRKSASNFRYRAGSGGGDRRAAQTARYVSSSPIIRDNAASDELRC
ncbi:MAG: hypothetical protein JWR80_5055 [Bradyrhizobium sp.]|nr:hypothetical protein [Bradyrhizobium sp.]